MGTAEFSILRARRFQGSCILSAVGDNRNLAQSSLPGMRHVPRFSALLLDHASAPRNGGPLELPDVIGRASLAGRAPQIAFHLCWDGNHIVRTGFQTNGCGVAIAACSALTELVADCTPEDCLRFVAADIAHALGGIPADKEFCAELAIVALRDGLMQLSRLRDPERVLKN